MGGKRDMRNFPRSWIVVCLCFGALLASAPALRAQAADQQDPFYKRLLEEGKLLYDQGNFAAVVQNMEIACFGLLDSPNQVLECYIYLELAYYGLKNEEKAKLYDEKIRTLNTPDSIDSLKLPEPVVTRYKALKNSFDRIAGRTPRQPPAQTTVPPPAKTKTTPPPKTKIAATPPAQEPAVPLDNLTLARQQTNVDTKIVFYKRAVQNDPNNIDIYFELDDAYNKAKKYRDGAVLMELLLKYYPENVAARIRLAEDWLADKSYGKAVQVLTAALRTDPDHIGLRYLLGESYIGQRKYKEALAAFDSVLAGDPAYKDAEVLRKLCADKIK